MLIPEAQAQLDQRRRRGQRAIRLHPDALPAETKASDIVSDILTALFGPAGTYSYGGSRSEHGEPVTLAWEFLGRAFQSYIGDAEDYTRAPEPGEYGYEGERA